MNTYDLSLGSEKGYTHIFVIASDPGEAYEIGQEIIDDHFDMIDWDCEVPDADDVSIESYVHDLDVMPGDCWVYVNGQLHFPSAWLE